MLDAEFGAFLVETDDVSRNAVVQKVVFWSAVVEGPETFEHVLVAVIVAMSVMTLRCHAVKCRTEPFFSVQVDLPLGSWSVRTAGLYTALDLQRRLPPQPVPLAKSLYLLPTSLYRFG